MAVANLCFILLLQLAIQRGSSIWNCSTDENSYVSSKDRRIPRVDNNSNKSELLTYNGDSTAYQETRRHAIHRSLKSSLATTTTLLLGISPDDAAVGASNSKSYGVSDATDSKTYGISDALVRSFVFEKILGKGSYKTVYMVTGIDPEQNNQPVRFALAVEQLRTKREGKDALRGISIAQQLRERLVADTTPDDHHEALWFENIVGWWVQDMNVPEFSSGRTIFPHLEATKGRVRKVPSQFVGSKWLIAVKSLYDMDLKSFAQKVPTLYPIGDHTIRPENRIGLDAVAGVPLTQQSAFQLTLELCHAGRMMHSEGVVHRDIKPKNIMLSNGHPVIIDFEFARFVHNKDRELETGNSRVCIVEPGRIKGEARYVLAEDVASYRGCQEGDLYAMGKTLYETIFGEARGSQSSERQSITVDVATLENEAFRSKLAEGASRSRFYLTSEASKVILNVIAGLCRRDKPLTFADAETTLVIETEKMAQSDAE